MKLPFVSRNRLIAAESKIGLLQVTLGVADDAHERTKAELAKVSGHNVKLKESLGSARTEVVKANAEIKGQQQEIERLTIAFEKLTADYNELGKKIPAFRPKRVKWSGPDGARALMERANFEQSTAGRREAAQKIEI